MPKNSFPSDSLNGLCATSGWIPFASYPVNFIKPIHPTTSTTP
jgi:hypothetical protein